MASSHLTLLTVYLYFYFMTYIILYGDVYLQCNSIGYGNDFSEYCYLEITKNLFVISVLLNYNNSCVYIWKVINNHFILYTSKCLKSTEQNIVIRRLINFLIFYLSKFNPGTQTPGISLRIKTQIKFL